MQDDEEHKPIAETPDVSHIHTPGVAHEHSDVKVGRVAWFTAGLAALMVLTGVLMWGMFSFFATTERRKEPPPTSLTREKKPESGNPEEMFPEPRLQRWPIQDLEEYRDLESKKLTGYGWIDQNAGVVHIPIGEAKKKLLKEGLPFRQSTTARVKAPKQQSASAAAEGKQSTAPSAHDNLER